MACIHKCSLNLKSGALGLKKLPFTIIDWWKEGHLIIQILTVQALKGTSQTSVYLTIDSDIKTIVMFLVLVEITFEICVVHVAHNTISWLWHLKDLSPLYTLPQGWLMPAIWVLAQSSPIWCLPKSFVEKLLLYMSRLFPAGARNHFAFLALCNSIACTCVSVACSMFICIFCSLQL